MVTELQEKLKDVLKKEKDLILYIRFWTLGTDSVKKYWHEEIGMYKYHDDNSVRIDRMNGLNETSVSWDTVGDLRIIPKWEAVRIINQLEKFARSQRKDLEKMFEATEEFLLEIYK